MTAEKKDAETEKQEKNGYQKLFEEYVSAGLTLR